MALWRYDPEGTPDTDFNGSGYVRDTTLQNAGDCVALDATGRILITGWSPNANGDDDLAIWRVNADATLDMGFSGGFVTHDGAAGGNGADEGRALVIDDSGRILVTGQSTNAAGDADMAVWRYGDDGVLDTAPPSGFVTIGGSAGGTNGSDGGRGLRIDDTGRVIVAGRSTNAAGNLDMTIWRLIP